MTVSIRESLPWAGVLVLLGGLAAFFGFRESDKAEVYQSIDAFSTRMGEKIDGLTASMTQSNRTQDRMDERLRVLVEKVGGVAVTIDTARVDRARINDRMSALELKLVDVRKDVDRLLEESKKP